MSSVFAAWGTPNSRRATNPLVRWVERKRGGVLLTTPRMVFSLKFGDGTESNRSVTRKGLKAKDNDRRKSVTHCHVKFRGLLI
ncbi:hypothetical protein TNCV_3735611 [Trichonephila clavipes]|nr:hypothetical protein TNCV_3735611 [Trichonephila clavipes]